MSKNYVSLRRLKQFIDNITEAEVKTRAEVDYLLAVKDGRVYRVAGESAPYLLVEPEEIQWIGEQAVVYTVKSNTSWTVE